MFDIKDIYSSIQEELLNKGLKFAQEYIDVTSKGKQFLIKLQAWALQFY